MCADIAPSLRCIGKRRRFAPAQKWSLLTQAYEYERLAIAELEAHYMGAAA
jgi:hypothetical protein